MPKFPRPRELEAIRGIEPAVKTLVKGTRVARVYFTGGEYPTRWDEFRHFGPTNARFDHHVNDAHGEAFVQERSILYCAAMADTSCPTTSVGLRRAFRRESASLPALRALAPPPG